MPLSLAASPCLVFGSVFSCTDFEVVLVRTGHVVLAWVACLVLLWENRSRMPSVPFSHVWVLAISTGSFRAAPPCAVLPCRTQSAANLSCSLCLPPRVVGPPAAYAPYHERLLLLGLSCLLHLCCWWVPLPRCLILLGVPANIANSPSTVSPSQSCAPLASACRRLRGSGGRSQVPRLVFGTKLHLEITNATGLGARPLEAGPRSSPTGEGCRHGGWRHIATKPAELLRPRLVHGRNTEVHAVDPREEVIEPRVTFSRRTRGTNNFSNGGSSRSSGIKSAAAQPAAGLLMLPGPGILKRFEQIRRCFWR